MTGGLSFTRSRGSLADLYKGHDNGIGLLRLILAVAVVFSHSKPLGFGQQDLGYYLFGRQTNVGTLAVYGFFVLSGMLITRSARRSSLGRYAWHRGLRIMPALWVCLLVSAVVLAPLVTLRENGNLDGFWSGPNGPFDYFRANMWTGLRQFGIHEIFEHTTPYGRHTGNSVFDGALWSLSYEMLRSLVGSEMCIRDRSSPTPRPTAGTPAPASSTARSGRCPTTVSYTHLTLPTILRV